MALFRYQREILLIFKIMVPLIGIIFLGWSIGTIFLYFCFDLLFIAGETILKILLARKSSIASRFGTVFRFLICYLILLFFLFVVVGYSFDGKGPGNMRTHFEMSLLYGLLVVYLLDFLLGFIFSGMYRNVSSKDVEMATYGLLVVIFLLLTGIILLFQFFVSPESKNYVLAIAIIVARELAAYFLGRKNQPKQVDGLPHGSKIKRF